MESTTIDNNVYPRQNILDFVQDEQQLTLFLLGLRAVQHKTIKDPMSYWQLSGIHGMPYVTYDDVPPAKNGSGGYCNHGNPLFPTWHRPYMKIFENSIRDEAIKIVESWTWLNIAPDIALSWKQAAARLRLPYWDWASHQTEVFGIPDILTQDTVTVKIPTGNAIPSVDLNLIVISTATVQPLPPDTVQEMKIANPLKAYTLPKPLGKIQASSDIFNPTQRPYTPPLNGDTPFTPKGFATVRHPDSNYRTQNDKLNLSTQRYSAVTLRPSVWMSFQEKYWKYYSNHYSSPDESKQYAHFSSLEVVHDALHDAIGGEGGHMSYPDVAAFDPIFWLHHCNVDRLLALWQRCWTGPESWVDEAGFSIVEANFSLAASTPINAETPLTPFKRSRVFQNNKLEGMCTSNDVRDVRQLGYTYPELEKFDTLTADEFLQEMLKMYKPVDYIDVIYLAEFDKIPKKKLGGPYSIRVFIDKKDANANTPLSDPHYAGSVSVFARDAETQCANCEDKLFIRGQVDLTRCMKNLSLTLYPEDPESYIAGLKKHISLVLVNQAGQQIDSRIAGLTDADRLTDQDTFKVVFLRLADGRVVEEHKKFF